MSNDLNSLKANICVAVLQVSLKANICVAVLQVTGKADLCREICSSGTFSENGSVIYGCTNVIWSTVNRIYGGAESKSGR